MCSTETCSRCDFDLRFPSDVIRPICSTHSNAVYIVYRIFVAVYFMAFLIVHLSKEIFSVTGLKIFIYLSDWTLILVTLYLIVAFLNAIGDYAYYQRNTRLYGTDAAINSIYPPILYRFQWFLFNVCIITSMLIAASYWPTVGYDLPPDEILLNFNIHALPTIVLVLDLLITAVPIRFLHVVYALALGGVYLGFAAIYWAAGGTDPVGRTYIYGILNFDDPRVVLIVVAAEAIGAIVFQWLLAGVTLLRNRVTHDCGCNPRRDDPEEIPLTDAAIDIMMVSYS